MAQRELDRSQESEFLAQVRGYLVQALLRPFVPYPQGRHVVQNMMLNIWLPVVLDHVADATGIAATRGKTATNPSVAYFMALALKKRGFKHLKEQEINPIYWRRKGMAARLEASMPAISPSPFKKNV